MSLHEGRGIPSVLSRPRRSGGMKSESGRPSYYSMVILLARRLSTGDFGGSLAAFPRPREKTPRNRRR
jgi:hypothetical protein